jgi:hypothetical protein
VSGLIGGAKTQSTSEKRLQGIQLQRSVYGDTIPLVYGKARVPGALIWYGNFRSTAIVQEQGGKGGGGVTSTSYIYRTAVMLALAEGPITAVGTVYEDKAITSLAELGLTLFSGAGGQATWAFLPTYNSAQAIPYDHTAYVASSGLELGHSAGLPTLSFEVTGFLPYGSGIDDAEPAAILADYLGSASHGAQFPYLGTITGAHSFQTYCIARGIFISPEETTQRQAAEFLKELMAVTNSEVVWSAGVLKVLPYADEAVTGNGQTYTPNMAPVYALTDDDFLPGEPPVELIRKPQSERYNRVRIEYLDRSHQYNTAVAEAWDDADIALNGERVMPTINLHAIKTGTLAKQVAQIILQRQLYTVNAYRFRLRPDYSLLEPMDLLSITDSTLALDNQLVRITSITDDPDDVLTIEADEVPLGIASSPQYNWELAQGYAANYNVSPGNVSAPLIFAAPSRMVGPAGGSEIWVAITGADANWGGCSVWASFDDLDYRLIGSISGESRYGVLSASTASHADPDTAGTVAVTMATTTMQLTGGTQADVDGLRANMIYVGGEIMAFRDASLTAPGAYTLTYLRRGLYGSAPASHSSGAAFARIDDRLAAIPYDPGLAGTTMYLKFTSFNIYGRGEQDLSAVSPYTTVLPLDGSYQDNAENIWTVAGTASVFGQSIFKASGSNAEDSAATTKETQGMSSALSFRCSVLAKEAYIGLTTATSGTASSALEYAWRVTTTSGTAQVWESGTQRTVTVPTFTRETVFSITNDGLTVRYLMDGVLIYASPSNGQPMRAKAIMVTVGGQLDTVKFGMVSGGFHSGPNKLNVDGWRAGASGTVGNFVAITSPTPSSIVLGGATGHPLGPYGQSEAIWRTIGNGAAGNGGWDNGGDITGIDPGKSYRSVVWVRWNGVGAPQFYHGCDYANTLTLAGAPDSNPYFMYGAPATLGIVADKWYLSVGVIHGYSYSGGDSGIAGLYDPATGLKIYDGTEFKMRYSAQAMQMQRVYQYYTNNSYCLLYFAKPRFEAITGNEATIQTLLSPQGALAYLDEVDTPQLVGEAATSIVRTNAGSSTLVENRTGPINTNALFLPAGTASYYNDSSESVEVQIAAMFSGNAAVSAGIASSQHTVYAVGYQHNADWSGPVPVPIGQVSDPTDHSGETWPIFKTINATYTLPANKRFTAYFGIDVHVYIAGATTEPTTLSVGEIEISLTGVKR